MRGFVFAALAASLLLGACGPRTEGTFSGYVEGDLIYVGPEEAGRLIALNVAEGDQVRAGQALAKVQDDLQNAELDAAAAQLKEAEANLAKAKESVQRPEEVAILEASERRAAATLDLSRIELERQKTLVPKGASSQANLDTAKHQYDQNAAALDEARRRIAAARIASRDQDIAAATQAMMAAQANLAAAKVRYDRRVLKAPDAGAVQTLYYRVGEVVPEGRPVLSLLPPGLVKVRFFVPEAKLPSFSIGSTVLVECDGCALSEAVVSFISDSAEYTPPVIYSREERAKLVYLIEARPRDPARARPGQPVTVRLLSGPAGPATAQGAKP